MVVFFGFDNQAFGEKFGINDDKTGGDCNEIGIWDISTKTCFMNRDLKVGDQIRINDDGVSLDGQGHHITGDGLTNGVYIPDRHFVKVVNLQISNTKYGIFLNNSSDNTIANVTTVWNTKHGIYAIHGSDRNTISNNLTGYNMWWGISIGNADENYITNNFVTRTKDAIRLEESNNNIISGNYVWENRVEGIDFHRSSENLIKNNNVFEKGAISILDDCQECGNKYSGTNWGNYYEAFDEIAEGCVDANSDEFCDEPFGFDDGGIDQYPSVKIIQNNGVKHHPHDFPLKFDDWSKGEKPQEFKVLVADGHEEEYTQTDEFSTFIPDWARNVAFWYYIDSTSEREFIAAVEYLIQKGILQIPPSNSSQLTESTIPEEIKIKLGLWGYGFTDDNEFVNLVNQLAELGLIKI